ncbi:MAG: hypothetical protein SH868_14215 [Bythopirellula sp.]|nr:hypothetical protein [Bythopirellula sp.]
MHGCNQRFKLWPLVLATILTLTVSPRLHADPALYEPGIDPGVGFNLVSWGNFGNGATVWQNAVQSAFDAGFDEVSLSPVRYYTAGTGAIAATSSSGPELSHIAAGIVRAKQLGMRVTVNPFIEPVGFTGWRGFYNPTPNSGEWTNFWNNYQQYMVDVATIAQANGADAVSVGTELRALELNVGNNPKWTSVLDAVDGVFTGEIGYASNWDSYNSANTATAIWDHPAVDYVGIDSYFQNLLSSAQANASGTYPNTTFISQVENAWNNKLDNEILPFAAARQGGTGLPVKFTEIGYLPYNGTAVTPQNGSGTLDDDEQNMVFEGFMRALDGRQASGEFLAAHIWQWDMQGSNGSQWNMNPNGGNQPTNQQTAQWLSSFMNGTNVDPFGPPGPTPTTQVLYSFEPGLEGFAFPNFGGSTSSLAQATGTGATEGTKSLAITKTDDDWTWDARVFMGGTQLQAMQNALADDIDNYVLEMDISYETAALPVGLTDLNMHVSFQPTGGAWTQAFPFADINSRVTQSFHVEIPLNTFNLSAGLSGLAFHIGFVGAWPNGNNATIYVDNIALTDLFPDSADFDGDGDVDGRDFLAWQRGAGDANGDGTTNHLDLAIWQTQYGTINDPPPLTAPVPEPTTALFCLLIVLAAGGRRCHSEGA